MHKLRFRMHESQAPEPCATRLCWKEQRMSEPKNLWGGRFTGAADPGFVEFNRSFGFDRRLFEADIKGSLAHAGGLRAAGVLSTEEAATIESGLRKILETGRSDEEYFNS